MEQAKSGKDPLPGAKERLDYLDGLRGFAILMVMLRHYYMYAYDRGFPRWADAFGYEIGVRLFIILSGFGLAWAYLGPRQRSMDLRDFYHRRITRILPAYYISLSVAVLLAFFVRKMPLSTLFWQTATHATMTHNLFHDTVMGLYGPFWSLALECQLYLIFPLLLWGLRHWSVLKTLALVLILQLIFRIWALRFGVTYNEYTFTVQWSLLGRAFSFAAAMASTLLVAYWLKNPPSKKGTFAITVGFLTLIVGGMICRSRLGVVHPVTGLLWNMGLLGLLLACAAGNRILVRLFTSRWLSALGAISYSVFLTHGYILDYALKGTFRLAGRPVSPLLMLPVVLAEMIVVGYLFYRFIEKPLNDYFYQRRKSRFACELNSCP